MFIFIANLFALYPAEFVRKAFDYALLGAQEKVQKVKIEYIICFMNIDYFITMKQIV